MISKRYTENIEYMTIYVQHNLLHFRVLERKKKYLVKPSADHLLITSLVMHCQEEFIESDRSVVPVWGAWAEAPVLLQEALKVLIKALLVCCVTLHT